MAIIDAVIGGIIGAVGTGVVGILLQKRREIKRRENLRKALLSELESMDDGFRIWQERENEIPHPVAFPTIIFESNCSKLGNISESSEIVSFYSNLIAAKEYIQIGMNKQEQGKEYDDWDIVMGFLDGLSEDRDELINKIKKRNG